MHLVCILHFPPAKWFTLLTWFTPTNIAETLHQGMNNNKMWRKNLWAESLSKEILCLANFPKDTSLPFVLSILPEFIIHNLHTKP